MSITEIRRIRTNKHIKQPMGRRYRDRLVDGRTQQMYGTLMRERGAEKAERASGDNALAS